MKRNAGNSRDETQGSRLVDVRISAYTYGVTASRVATGLPFDNS